MRTPLSITFLITGVTEVKKALPFRRLHICNVSILNFLRVNLTKHGHISLATARATELPFYCVFYFLFIIVLAFWSTVWFAIPPTLPRSTTTFAATHVVCRGFWFTYLLLNIKIMSWLFPPRTRRDLAYSAVFAFSLNPTESILAVIKLCGGYSTCIWGTCLLFDGLKRLMT